MVCVDMERFRMNVSHIHNRTVFTAYHPLIHPPAMLVKGVCAVAVRFNLISAPPSRGGAEACSDRRIMLAKSLPLGNSFAALKPPPRWSQIHARTSATKSARPRSVMTVGRPPGSRSAAARRALGDNVLSAPRKRECTVVCRVLSHLAPPCIVAPAAGLLSPPVLPTPAVPCFLPPHLLLPIGVCPNGIRALRVLKLSKSTH